MDARSIRRQIQGPLELRGNLGASSRRNLRVDWVALSPHASLSMPRMAPHDGSISLHVLLLLEQNFSYVTSPFWGSGQPMPPPGNRTMYS
jgi:hypothetical protein